VGINLFPDRKHCPFDCPYCEVFPFSTNAVFSAEQMEEDLRGTITSALEQNIPVMDICFSGNGEPTMSADFPRTLKLADDIRKEMVPAAKLVLITCGTGLLEQKTFTLLREAANDDGLALDIWLKLDAATRQWYERINRCAIPHEKLVNGIKEFASCAPVTIQTMLCEVDGTEPPPEEAAAWERLMLELSRGGKIRKIQIYGKARPSPDDPKTRALPAEYLDKRAAQLRQALNRPLFPLIEVYP
jgi:histidinol dehydrogenase